MIDPTKKGFIYELGSMGSHTRRLGTLPGVIKLHLDMLRHHDAFLREMFSRNEKVKLGNAN